ncbi:MAG: hypothetical protein AAF354_14845 [Pseudomonadota bacterium]
MADNAPDLDCNELRKGLALPRFVDHFFCMKHSSPAYTRTRPLSTAIIAVILIALSAAPSVAEDRTIVLRERAVASVLDGAFTFKLMKIMGYTIRVKIAGENRIVKIGQPLTPDGAACSVVFEEISPETRIARFNTDCL